MKQGLYTKAIKRMAWGTESERFIILRKACIMDNGKIIKWMVLAFLLIQVEK